MEYRPFGPEEQDDETAEASPKKGRAGESLFRHLSLLRRKERAEAGGIESEDDTESDEKPKKWRKYFARIFPSIVERPEGDSPEKSNFDPETWLSWKNPKEVPQSDVEFGTEQATGAPITPDQEPTIVDQTGETPISPEATHDRTNERSAENQQVETDPDSEGELDHQTGGSSLTNLESQVLPVNQPENYASTTPEATELPSLAQENVAERRPAPDSPQSVTEKETIIERGVGSALPIAVIGLEYLGRKRADRKLESRINTKLESGNKEFKNSSNRQEELARIVRDNREQLEQLKRQHSQLEQASVPKTKEAEAVAVSRAEFQVATDKPYSQKPEAVRQPEVASDYRSKETSREAKITNEGNTESFQPDKILEQVAVAAEQDTPVERVFERSHEVKDDKTVPVGAASIGSVVQAQLSARKQANSPTFSASMASTGHSPDGLPIITDNRTPGQYKRAAAAGFSAALMIIILGSIAYLMVK